MAVKHNFASGKADGADATLVRPSDWNANHIIDAATIALSHLATDAKGLEILGNFRFPSSLQTSGALTIAARRILVILYSIAGYSGADIASFRFNADSGATYWTRWATAAVGLATLVNNQTLSANLMRLAGLSAAVQRSGFLVIKNDPETTFKVATGAQTDGAAAATGGTIGFGGGTWVSGASAQITSVEMRTAGGSITMPAGTGFVVLGKDT